MAMVHAQLITWARATAGRQGSQHDRTDCGMHYRFPCSGSRVQVAAPARWQDRTGAYITESWEGSAMLYQVNGAA